MKSSGYFDLFISACACLVSIITLFITVIKNKHEKPKAKIINIIPEPHISLDESTDNPKDSFAELNIYIVAKLSNDSLIYPLKLDYAELEYRNRQKYRFMNGSHWKKKIPLDITIDKGKNDIFKFLSQSTSILYSKKESIIEYPQELMLNRIRFHYANKNTKWFFVSDFFTKKYTFNIDDITKCISDKQSQIFLFAYPRNIKHKRLHIFKEKIRQNTNYFLTKNKR